MTKKLSKQALATFSTDEIPLFLQEEMGEFIKRNRMHKDKEESYCKKCLKAHLLEKIEEKGMEGWAREIVNELFPEAEGHGGYYLDAEKLKKITF